MSSFFSTYSSVANNKDSFKAYKQKKLDEKSKREDYFKEHPVDQKTLEESKKKCYSIEKGKPETHGLPLIR